MTYASMAKLSSNFDAWTSWIIDFTFTNFLGIYVTSTPKVLNCSLIRSWTNCCSEDVPCRKNGLSAISYHPIKSYGGTGDVLTKFGMSLRDEVTLTISKERFEDFISPFMSADDYLLSSRPREGDLVYFPLGQRLFEVKFVEHENPFYQLGTNYVYELKCELFEYEDEVIDTSIEAIDTQVEDEGYIQELQLVGVGRTALASSSIDTGYIR